MDTTEALARINLYTPGGAPVRRSRQRLDTYGLKGLFRLSYERVEEYTD